VAYDGHGKLMNPVLNHDGRYRQHEGYITDIMNGLAVDYLKKKRPGNKPFALFFAHKAVHPDAEQAADGTLKISAQGGYVVAERHRNLYKRAMFPARPNVLSPAEVVKMKPAWAECFELKKGQTSKAILKALNAGTQEEIRLRARMMAAVDEGVGDILKTLEETGELDNTCIIFLGDNGYFFGEHGLGPERRFAYEEGIRSPFAVRYPPLVKAGSSRDQLVICQDIAPTLIELAGGQPGPQIQGRSLVPAFKSARARLRRSVLVEYWAENAMPWLVGMTYKAVRTDRYKLIHWVNRGRSGELDELYDLDQDPYEMRNLIDVPDMAPVRDQLRKELGRLVQEAVGL
jgi:N-acetylglucosamine-6-sulfatase